MDVQELDMNNRDPNSINAHLGTLKFDEVIAEPEGIRSIDCIWKLSYTCFECWKSLLYKLLTTCFGICIAAEWGCEFAYIAFYHIWYITPIVRICEINCALCQKVYSYCINCMVLPVCEACGALFVHFKK